MIVPVKPEFLAAIGVPLLARSLKAFKERFGDHTIEIAGIVFVHLEGHSPGPESKTLMAEVTRVAKDEGWRIFSHEIPFSRVYAKAAREGQPLEWTSRAYQSPKAIKAFNGFMNELFGVLGIEKKLPEAGMREYV